MKEVQKMDNNQQYKWRQRKKRNAMLTVWILLVILLAAIAVFIYEGMKESNPLTVAENYVTQVVGVTDYSVETGDRSLNADNQFVQDYTFTYTADGQEKSQKVSMTQDSEKKFGLFEQWAPSSNDNKKMDIVVIAPKDSQVLLNGVAPGETSIVEDADLSPAAVRYQFTNVDVSENKLQINGLPFDSYEGTLDGSSTVVDVRDDLKVGENAQTQMLEIGKSMIHELYTAVFDETGADKLSALFDKAANKENLYRAIQSNLYEDGKLKVDSLTFSDFKTEFGDVYYPGTTEENYIGIEMKLTYTVSYDSESEAETESETETETETEGGETESESESESETEKAAGKSVGKTATFYFEYRNGECSVRTIEVPSAL